MNASCRCAIVIYSLLTRRPGNSSEAFGDGGKVDLADYGDTAEPARYSWALSPACREGCRGYGLLLPGRDGVIWGSGPATSGPTTCGLASHRWTFHVIPRPGEFGNETWLEGSWNGIQAGEADVWTMISADEELGLVYLPTSAPTNGMYGGHRPGANLFSQQHRLRQG